MSERAWTVIRHLLPTALLCAASGSAWGEAPEFPVSWEKQYYDPNAVGENGDFFLPMPCGGEMVFRPVTVASKGVLDDQRIEVGLTDETLGFAEDRRFEHIAGTFSNRENSGQRIYYIGKYEVSKQQYAALQSLENDGSGHCPEGGDDMMMPQTNVSWFDAVSFGRVYTEWLMEHAIGRLPVEGDLPGFLRLPTEVEWEYAARGGIKVSPTDFIGRVFPMPEGDFNKYVWYSDTQSAGGEIQPIGLLSPNPLGLHDMLGNASEMVFDPYRLNRRGRLHGQAGGLTTKGGDVSTSRIQLRSSMRVEGSLFDASKHKASSNRFIGFRLALTAPILVSKVRLTDIKSEWQKLPAGDGTDQTALTEASIRAAIEAAARETANVELRNKLQAANSALGKAETERNEARDRALKALVQTGAIFGVKVRADQIRLATIETAQRSAQDVRVKLERILLAAGKAGDRTAAAEARQALTKAEEQLRTIEGNRQGVLQQSETSLSFYTDLVITVAADNSPVVVLPQLQILKVEFQAKSSGYLVPAAELFVRHMEEYRRLGRIDRSKWLGQIME